MLKTAVSPELLKWFVGPLYYDQIFQFKKLFHNIWCKKPHTWSKCLGFLRKI